MLVPLQALSCLLRVGRLGGGLLVFAAPLRHLSLRELLLCRWVCQGYQILSLCQYRGHSLVSQYWPLDPLLLILVGFHRLMTCLLFHYLVDCRQSILGLKLINLCLSSLILLALPLWIDLSFLSQGVLV